MPNAMITSRTITYAQAILEGTAQCMKTDPRVYIMGLGVPDPKGVFGTTLGLHKRFGNARVMDMPVSENGMTGIAIGSCLVGMRPIMTHQRTDFMLLALDQMINNAAKWHYMFGGQSAIPIVFRILVGQGWGQGPQHSQSLQALFAHIPGLKVVMPFSPYDAKGLLISAIEDDNPVVFIEHRWLHNITGKVPRKMYRVPIGRSRTVKKGTDVTIVSSSYMTLEALRAAEMLRTLKITPEIIDLRSIKPLDEEAIERSIRKTGRLLAVDGAWRSFGVSAEITALAAEQCLRFLKCPPKRLAFPDTPVPTSPALAEHYYLRARDIAAACASMLGKQAGPLRRFSGNTNIPLDIPDKSFTGPF